ncbi:serine/threonine-protein kinase [Crateriforma conspicua]|uniref:Serine/threonine-protein kinase PknB n=1 Tax=Crateriforma conspicua TaxID=2527996 RepID=A0A5C6G004_9PLAN|nr:serine/threonine-protein kinase [Crateriforma conspicua]TWU66880.1 Serine/threonine-protein kinase PknB [Crateriforma conspicua]
MTTEEIRCPSCGKSLPASSPLGQQCPSCMLAAGLGGQTQSFGNDDAFSNSIAETSASGTWTPQSAESIDQLFDAVDVVELIGHGGMGAVYRARQSMLGRDVALKVLSPALSGDARFADRFMREARALAQLSHPGIVTVYDFGRRGDVLYLIMEFVDGVNLREAMRAEAMSPDAAIEVVLQISAALQYAHAAGVVHRDIKPENILLERSGRVRLVDFGLAKLTSQGERDATLTGTNQVIGTMHYMAPEQWERPGQVDHRADIYSLGVVFYELLTGQLPLGRFKLPSESGLNAIGLDDVVLKTLQRAPQDRYQSVGEMSEDVSRMSESSSTGNERASGVVSPPSPPDASSSDVLHGTAPEGLAHFHRGRLLTGVVLVCIGIGLLLHGLINGFVTMWIGPGIAINGFVFMGIAFAGADEDVSDQDVSFVRSPNVGLLVFGTSMLWGGAIICPGGFDSPFGWTGMGLMIGGAYVMGTAWEQPKNTILRPWNWPKPAPLFLSLGMVLIGAIVLIGGIMSGRHELIWSGLGLTIGGGAISIAAWTDKVKKP